MELRAADAGEWAAITAVHHAAATEAYASIFEPYADVFANEASGWTSVNLWVLEAYDRARRFYERRGWHPVPGRTIENPPTPILDVLYERSL